MSYKFKLNKKIIDIIVNNRQVHSNINGFRPVFINNLFLPANRLNTLLIRNLLKKKINAKALKHMIYLIKVGNSCYLGTYTSSKTAYSNNCENVVNTKDPSIYSHLHKQLYYTQDINQSSFGNFVVQNLKEPLTTNNENFLCHFNYMLKNGLFHVLNVDTGVNNKITSMEGYLNFSSINTQFITNAIDVFS